MPKHTHLSYGFDKNIAKSGDSAIMVNTNVKSGGMFGKNWWSISWTRPPVFEETPLVPNTVAPILSAKLYKAQKFGAQYAWHRPLLNGNSLLKTCIDESLEKLFRWIKLTLRNYERVTCGIWFKNGPNDKAVTPIVINANLDNLTAIWNGDEFW